jgi:flagellar basal-body rod modification protein FlgD
MTIQSAAPASSNTGAGATTTSSANPMAGLGSDQFMLLLLTELRNQNPLEPMDNKDLMGQITQMNSLQELQKINDDLEALNHSNQLTEAAGLIGKKVEYQVSGADPQTGVVSGVSLMQDQIMLWVGDSTVPLSSLITVSADDAAGGDLTHV